MTDASTKKLVYGVSPEPTLGEKHKNLFCDLKKKLGGNFGVIASLALLIALLFGYSVCASGLSGGYDEKSIAIVMDLLSAIVTSAIIIATALDNKALGAERKKQHHRGVFEATCFCVFLFISFDLFSWFLDGTRGYLIERYAFALGANLFAVLCAVMTTHYVEQLIGIRGTVKRVCYYTLIFLGIADMILMAGSLPAELLFRFENGTYVRGSLWSLFMAYPIVALAADILTVLLAGHKTLAEKRGILSYLLLPLLGAALQVLLPGFNLATVVAMLGVLICYSGLYLQNSRSLLEKENALAGSQMNALLLQINPHFIYNTIGSIASCCRYDPEQAEKMLYIFSDYLRNNFGELAQKTLVPFTTEAEHLDAYITIEKMRFPDIVIETDYAVMDFELPSLSVQPLVENAITHGIMGKEEGGLIRIRTFEDENNRYIEVEDDGIGFAELKTNDGRNHIGIRNVNDRLQMLCGGSLQIESCPGIGTTARIILPRS